MYVWMVATVAAYGLCCWVVWRHCAHLRHCPWLVALLAAGAPALRFTLAFAQASAVGLLCMTGAYCALRAKRPFLAGVAFGALRWPFAVSRRAPGA